MFATSYVVIFFIWI